MSKSDETREFLELYEQYANNVLKPTRAEIKNHLNDWLKSSFWSSGSDSDRLLSPSPINTLVTRVKRPEKTVDKILKQPQTFPEGLTYKSLRIMNDVVAGRIIVYFLSDLALVHNAIVGSELFEISKKSKPAVFLEDKFIEKLNLQDLEKRGKDTGYCAIHYILKLKDSSIPEKDRPWFEVQLKTLAQHVWGEIEHVLGYKPSTSPSMSMRKQFKIISAHLNAIDEHFDLLCEDISGLQKTAKYTKKSVLDPENLPAVLKKIGIGCAQDELNGLLRILVSRGIKKVGELERLASGDRLDIIKETYKDCDNRIPNNFEIVATLAAIKGIKNEGQIPEAIETQINFNKAWDQIK